MKYLAALCLFVVSFDHASSDRSKIYELPRDCGKSKEIDGALLVHRMNSPTVRCTMTFATDTKRTEKKFNLEVNITVMSEDSKLLIYYDKGTIKPPTVEFNYKNSHKGIRKPLTSIGQYVTIVYSSKGGIGFNIVLTSFRPSSGNRCKKRSDFFCPKTKICIDDELKCDGVGNCFEDDADERNCKGAMGGGGIAGTVLSALMMVFCCGGVCFVCKKRHDKQLKRDQTSSRYQPGHDSGPGGNPYNPSEPYESIPEGFGPQPAPFGPPPAPGPYGPTPYGPGPGPGPAPYGPPQPQPPYGPGQPSPFGPPGPYGPPPGQPSPFTVPGGGGMYPPPQPGYPPVDPAYPPRSGEVEASTEPAAALNKA